MRAQPPLDLLPGDVLWHPEWGLALVEGVEAEHARLDWEDLEAGRPQRVSREMLGAFLYCAPWGFFHRVRVHPLSLRDRVLHEPARIARLLCEDLGRGLSVEQIRHETEGRGLVPAWRFSAWMDQLQERLDDEPRLSFADNELRLSPDPELAAALNAAPDVAAALFLELSPSSRLSLLRQVELSRRHICLQAALAIREPEAILVALRCLPELPPEFEGGLISLMEQGDVWVGLALVERRMPAALTLLRTWASRPRSQAWAGRVTAACPSGRRTALLLDLIARALESGEEESAAFFAEQLPSGITGALALVDSGALDAQALLPAIHWLRHRVLEAPLDQPQAPEPVLLAQLRPLPPERVLPTACNLARALAHRHAMGERGGVAGAHLVPPGRVELGPPDSTSAEDDVQAAVRLICELAIGTLPARVDSLRGDELLGHLAALVPAIPLEWMSVAARALCPAPALRPRNGLDLWEQLEQAMACNRVRQDAPYWASTQLEVAHDTHIGLMKSRAGQTNQDAWFYQAEDGLALLVVADGISVATAGSGNLASSLLVQSLAGRWEQRQEQLRRANEDQLRLFLIESLEAANHAICDAALRLSGHELSRHIPMGTTAVIALVRGNRVILASLGDSRAYLVGGTGACLLTAEQNVKGDWLRACQAGQPVELLSEGYALTSYAGHFDEDGQSSPVPPMITSFAMLPGEVLLLCSDGLTDYAAGTHAEMSLIIEEAARSADMGMACRRLVDRANENGGGDNITVILARAVHN